MNIMPIQLWKQTSSVSRAAPLLELQNIAKRFGGSQPGVIGWTLRRLRLAKQSPQVHAVAGVNLSVRQGEIVGLVGESGCGKSTLGRIAAGLLPPTKGEVYVKGHAIAGMSPRERLVAQLSIQMIFQNPLASLNPRKRVSGIVGEGALRHGLVTHENYDDYICEQLQATGLDPSLRFRYPHQFSGGQRQRIGIARALAVRPELLVCDEAVSALDVSIQAQILNLFMDLREKLGLAYLFISHDLGVIRHLCDHVVVMYLGRVVESAPTADLFARPSHPYTKALLAEIPRVSERRIRFHALKGELPSPLTPPRGCHFHPRCPFATARCREDAPALRDIAPNHATACHLHVTG